MRAIALADSLGRLLLIAAIAFSLPESAFAGSTYKILHSFNGSDGAGPWGGVALGPDRSVYGTTAGGGACGTVFRLTPHANGQWKETVLYQFGSGDDPCDPNSSVIFDKEHNLYATTVGGGTYLAGTVFELTPGAGGWSDTTLYSFGTRKGDGGSPTAGLIADGSGNLFGTTPRGDHWSTVFELTPGSGGWNENVLYRFCESNLACEDGTAPYAGLIIDSAGSLYGTTRAGGAYNGGTVYELQHTSDGWQEKVLHSFHLNQTDGNTPGWGSLFIDSSGNLYGTTVGGGCCGGVIFKLTPESDGGWKETILYNFQTGATGHSPNAGVVMDKGGNLYGTTDYGGDPYCGCGVIYKLSPGPKGKWTYTVLHEFGLGNDGGVPEGNLVMDSKGNLYGGTVLGGTYGGGVVFELTP